MTAIGVARQRGRQPDRAAEEPRERLHRAALVLHVDVVTVEVVDRLRDQGVRALLLKGPSFASWLYEPGESRPYVDCDLLVDSNDLQASAGALIALGFARGQDEGAGQAFSEPHAVTWHRGSDRAAVDLHWRIPGVAIDPALAWRRFSAETESATVAGRELETLAEPARALHVALHAVQNGRLGEQSMSDLARGVERLELSTWRAAADLAGELDALMPFTAGLRLDPGGTRLADRLGLPDEVPERWRLWAQTPQEGAVRLHELLETPGWRAKAAFVRFALLPPPSYVHALYPDSRRSRVALVRVYLSRAVAGIRNAPGAIRSLRRARAGSPPGR